MEKLLNTENKINKQYKTFMIINKTEGKYSLKRALNINRFQLMSGHFQKHFAVIE